MKISRIFGIVSILYMHNAYNLEHAAIVQQERGPLLKHRLKISFVKNDTLQSDFKLFPAMKPAAGLITAQSTLYIPKSQSDIYIDQLYPIMLTCVKGSFLPIFIQDGGLVGGLAPAGYDGPYYVSMWLQYPHLPLHQRLVIPYVVKSGKIGSIGVNIDERGGCQLSAEQHVIFLQDEH